jgi:starch synthase
MLANQVYAAGDFFLIPSRYEPCGLTDYIAQLFGNLPVVHHVGGLVKVQDGKTGFAYLPQKGSSFIDAMERAFFVYDQPQKKYTMQVTAVKKIFSEHSWQKVMTDYISLYEKSQPDN